MRRRRLRGLWEPLLSRSYPSEELSLVNSIPALENLLIIPSDVAESVRSLPMRKIVKLPSQRTVSYQAFLPEIVVTSHSHRYSFEGLQQNPLSTSPSHNQFLCFSEVIPLSILPPFHRFLALFASSISPFSSLLITYDV